MVGRTRRRGIIFAAATRALALVPRRGAGQNYPYNGGAAAAYAQSHAHKYNKDYAKFPSNVE